MARLRSIQADYDNKKDTLKKLYLVHVEQTKRIEFLETQVQELKVGMDKAEERNVELNVILECLLLN